MITYLIINTVFVAVVLLIMRLFKISISKKWLIALVPLLILTAVFDPLIIYFDIVGYDHGKTLGLSLFGAPIEDFMYSLLAAIFVPSLWNHLHRRGASSD